MSNAYIMYTMERSIGWFKHEGMDDDARRHALAHELGIPFVQLGRDDILLDALVLIPEPLAREHNLLAYKMGDHLLEVALLDMADLEHLDFLRSNYRVLPRLTTRESLTRGLIRYQQHLRDTFGRALEKTDSPNLLDTLLKHAVHSRATDLHLQNDAGGLLVRYRINGFLKNAMTLPPAAGKNVISKLRTLAKVPAGALPHEGRLRVDLGSGEDLSVRVSSVPIVTGEKLVLHLSRERARRGYTLETLGLHGESLEAVYKMLLHRRGLLVVAGAPGSGKTTLLYTMLDLLNTPEHSLASIETVVGSSLPRVAQTEISSAGITPAAALRAALKADSDVVMLDADIDRETATVAMEAAKRGVLIIASAVNPEVFPGADMVIRTSLVRKLAGNQFSSPYKLTRAQSEDFEGAANFASVLAALKGEGRVIKDTAWKDIQFYKPVGSTEHPDGYHEFLGVQEVTGKDAPLGLNLVEDALFKAAQGQTSLEEVKKLLI